MMNSKKREDKKLTTKKLGAMWKKLPETEKIFTGKI